MEEAESLLIGEVIAIGDELTSGQRLDTNTKWLSERLTEQGVRVVYHTTVADDLEANVAVFRAAIDRADTVVSTGGLGPTADDLTRDALAATLNVELELDEKALEHVRGLFERRGRKMPERNRIQAMFPAGSNEIPNPNGTAPGIHCEVEREGRGPCHVFALPGVPAEMFPMWEESVRASVAAASPSPRVIRHRRIKCFGAGESNIEAMIPEMISRGREPLVGITASAATITLRITASGPDEEACYQKMEPTVAEIYDKLGTLVYGEEEDSLQEVVVKLLEEQQRTLGVSELFTAGRVCQLLDEADTENRWFKVGLVNAARQDYANEPDTWAKHAADMCRKIQFKEGTLGLAISQAQEVDKDTEQVYIALADGERVYSKAFPIFGTADLARIRTAKLALNFVRKALLRT